MFNAFKEETRATAISIVQFVIQYALRAYANIAAKFRLPNANSIPSIQNDVNFTWKVNRTDAYTEYQTFPANNACNWKRFALYKNALAITGTQEIIAKLETYCKEHNVTVSTVSDPMFATIESKTPKILARVVLAFVKAQENNARMQICNALKQELIVLTLDVPQIEEIMTRLNHLESRSDNEAAIQLGLSLIKTKVTVNADTAAELADVRRILTPLTFTFTPKTALSGTPKIGVNTRDEDKKTSLLRAVCVVGTERHIAGFEFMTPEQKRKYTTIGQAAIEDVRQLIAQGADLETKLLSAVRIPYSESNMDRHYLIGATPLAIAIQAALFYTHFKNPGTIDTATAVHFEQAQLLLAAGADPNAFDVLHYIPRLTEPKSVDSFGDYRQLNKFCFSRASRLHRQFIGNTLAMLLHYGAKAPTLESFTESAHVINMQGTVFLPINAELEFQILTSMILDAYNRIKNSNLEQLIDAPMGDVQEVKIAIKKGSNATSLEEIGAEARNKLKERERMLKENEAAHTITTLFIKNSHKQKKLRHNG